MTKILHPDDNESTTTRRQLMGGLGAMLLLPLAAGVAEASAAAGNSGRISFRITRAGLIVGLGGGTGTLSFNGKKYPLSIGGVSLGATIGIASADFVGKVRHLRRASDIAGTYSAVGAGLAAAGGGAVARLRNSRGVELEVSGKQVGFMASIDLSGLRIRLA
ncbi:hypothetical protein [Aestuariivirga sp.]|uniref:hypothetical protein n=1 Tax=Aestuariivirga sp. TaxID=2650926 RepID=UPI0025C1D998|nr:hypothetical protein [Aestuariivirga sp.]